MSDDQIDLDGLSDREILILLAKTVPGRLNDHGKRLRDLERFRNWAAGAGALGIIVAKALGIKLTASQ
jgi:hypothetical protein